MVLNGCFHGGDGANFCRGAHGGFWWWLVVFFFVVVMDGFSFGSLTFLHCEGFDQVLSIPISR